MKMLISIFLFFNILSFSFQTIPALFYCDDILRQVYLIDETTQEKQLIGTGNERGSWDEPNYFNYLNAAPGDLIRIICYTPNSGLYGGGCFLLNNICRCYNFYNPLPHNHQIINREANLNGISCSIPLNQAEVSESGGEFVYEQRIPLDVNGITCQNKLWIVPYNKNNQIKLSDYLTANFELKNLEVKIIENYDKFKLNNIQLNSNNKFKILTDNLIFNSNESKKIKITFINYGIILTGTKECSFNIRVCHPRCLDCNDVDGNDNNHQCTICVEGYFLIEDTYNCKTKQEMKGTNYYFDEITQKFKKCYEDCKTCSTRGDLIDMKCDTCGDPKKYYAEPHNCIDDITRYYLDEEEKIYKKCYKNCYSCNAKSIETEHNCTKCEDKYHFIYNETRKKNCIPENEKPINTYLDTETNTYELCYERCHSCSQKSTIVDNNCDECAKDDNKKYLYHFLENKKGQCITEKEKPLNTYFDSENNIYKYCYSRCSSCDEKGDINNNNCKECLKDENNNYIYHFLHDEKGKCISEDEKPENTFLDIETNTYELCYKKCSSCNKRGDINNNNCKECLKDESGNYIYHFIYDTEGKCINELERPLNSYLDKDTNTYRLCYERCSLCDKQGNETNNNCNDCTKDANNTYLYHFLYNETGRCLNETEKPKDTYLNEENNTYSKCYIRCSSCFKGGNESNNNCNECFKDENNIYLYHFLYNETGRCINESEKPTDTYLDKENNIYKKCYERCSSCDKGGNEKNNNCNDCIKNNNNTYIYHFLYNETGKCINESEKPEDTYLDKENNIYKKCYESCSSCNNGGNESNNNCKDCLKDNNNNYIYHFIYNEPGKCLSDEERPLNTYLNKENNTYMICSERCNRCENYPECKECLKDGANNYIYHFIQNEQGKCIDESEIKDGFYYLDTDDNTYKSCPEGTIRVVNNECIENNSETIILAFIIIIIILIFVPLFFIIRTFFKGKKRDKDMKQLIIN